MKKEPCLRLDEIASALSQADQARMAPELSPADRVIMEQACVTLREAERTAIVNVETGLVERFTQNASSVNLQAKNIRALVTKINKIPKSLVAEPTPPSSKKWTTAPPTASSWTSSTN